MRKVKSKLNQLHSYYLALPQQKKSLVGSLLVVVLFFILVLSVYLVNTVRLAVQKSHAAGIGVNILANGGFESGAVNSSNISPWVFTTTDKSSGSIPTPAPSVNLLLNPSFDNSTLTPWSLNVNAGYGTTKPTMTRDTVTTASKDSLASAKVYIPVVNATGWYVQFIQDKLLIRSGKSYTISFWVRSDAVRTIPVVIQQIGSPNTEYFRDNTTVSIPATGSNTWKQYTIKTPNMPVTNANVKLSFALATVKGNVWFDNVSLYENTDTVATPSAGLSFVGAGYVNIPNSNVLNPGNSSWSVSMYVKLPNINQNAVLISKDSPTYPYPSWAMWVCGDAYCKVSGKKINLYFFTASNSSYRSAISTRDIADGEWHNLTMVADKTANILKLYVDGALYEVTQAAVGSWPGVTNTAPLRIGANNLGNFMVGQMDEVRVFNTALTQSYIQANLLKEISPTTAGLVGYWRLNENGGVTTADETANHNIGTITGVAWTTGYVPSSSSALAPATSATVVTPPTPKEGAKALQVILGYNYNTVLLNQKNLILAPNTNYTLTFSAYVVNTHSPASPDTHVIAVSLTNADGSKNYGISKAPFNINLNWTTYTYQFRTPAIIMTDLGNLQFNFVQVASPEDVIYMDNVNLVKNVQVILPAVPQDQVLTKNILLVIYDPLLVNPPYTNLKLHQIKPTWNDPVDLTDSLVQFFKDASGNMVKYKITKTIEYNTEATAYPVKTSGIRPTEAQYLACLNATVQAKTACC